MTDLAQRSLLPIHCSPPVSVRPPREQSRKEVREGPNAETQQSNSEQDQEEGVRCRTYQPALSLSVGHTERELFSQSQKVVICNFGPVRLAKVYFSHTAVLWLKRYHSIIF